MMMIKKLVAMNFKQMQVAFFAGTTVGSVVGAVAGLGAGVALGLIFAPKSGKELRGELKDKGLEIAENVKERSLKLKEDAQVLYEDVSEKVADRLAS